MKQSTDSSRARRRLGSRVGRTTVFEPEERREADRDDTDAERDVGYDEARAHAVELRCAARPRGSAGRGLQRRQVAPGRGSEIRKACDPDEANAREADRKCWE